ncbi:M23 family metallopeptidase [Parvularcula dongshanensis]|uniref:Murein DD-endopeptidase MepM/ murein hydrolase activator NlpD n=1 Tax=Parvularcula dongshanensis TaxID=1173995 RepID=A0A840I0V4_9PROT|nr:M23 family metallopeptidase [Parvularcula dongshanensis]MBB4658459.1 murein DD-endopeptidase MepM/ murein hydrolase activator NlpD [Parvularcula dongshanensis]
MRALAALLVAACAAHAAPPEPTLSPSRTTPHEAAADDPAPWFTADSVFSQGGLAFGTTDPAAEVTLDGDAVPVSEDGRFVLGFGRDHGERSTLRIALPDGTAEERVLTIAPREWLLLDEITGVPDSKVNPYKPEDLERIRIGTEKKNAARASSVPSAFWQSGFDWPATGRITSHFGSYRTYNGVPKNPHSGVDVARPLSMKSPMDFVGTPVRAPADGVITLAEPDMFFEGGLVLIDHGQNLESALMHMSRIDVRAGDRVSQGDVLGGAGMTGRATGPHVHWSVKWHGTLVDPELLVGPMQ